MDHQNEHVGSLLLGSLVASVIFRNLSEVTAGDGARYDLELVNSAAWLAFFLFTLAAGMLTIVFLLRPLERLWLKRGKSH